MSSAQAQAVADAARRPVSPWLSVDTITTRFLMLFVALIVVPLVVVIGLSNTHLKSEARQAALEELQIIDALLADAPDLAPFSQLAHRVDWPGGAVLLTRADRSGADPWRVDAETGAPVSAAVLEALRLKGAAPSTQAPWVTTRDNGLWVLLPRTLPSGALRVLAQPVDARQRYANYLFQVSSIGVLALVLSALVAMAVARPITQPLLKLIQRVNDIQYDNLSALAAAPLDITGVNEIRQLSHAFTRMLNRLKQEHQMRDDFVATLTHDLKVPMLAEQQTLRYFLSETYGALSGEQREVLRVLEKTNADSLTLVNGLLEVYRYQSGAARLRLEQADLRALLEESVQSLKPLAQEKAIALTCRIAETADADAYHVHADAIELRRVLQNLLSNAISNTPPHGQIHCTLHTADTLCEAGLTGDIRGQRVVEKLTPLAVSSLKNPLIVDGRVVLSVQDSGLGFDADSLSQLFQQFSANRRRNPMSMGLGLYNCHQVIAAHHGTLWVESTEGQGSAIHVALPKNASVYQDRRRHERRQPASDAGKPEASA